MPGQTSETADQRLWPPALLNAIRAHDLRTRLDWAHAGITALASPGNSDIVGFDTVHASVGSVVDAYQNAIGYSADTTFLADPVEGRLAVGYVGSAFLTQLELSPARLERASALIAQDRYDAVSIQLNVSGRSSGTAGSRQVTTEPGTVLIIDYTQPFLLVDEGPRQLVSLAFPRPLVTARLGDPRELHGMVIEADRAALLAAYLRALPPQLGSLPPLPAADRLAGVVLELLAVALERAAPPARTGRPDRREALAERARRMIEIRLGCTDLSPELLMNLLSVSRSDLYSLFEEAGGVARYIWRRRLEAAHAALIDPSDRRRIGEIAFACGFSSEAHFSRAFRLQFGMTPSTARRGAP